MKKIIIAFVLFFQGFYSAQTNMQIDSLAAEFCKELKNVNNMNQIERYDFTMKKIEELEKNNIKLDKDFYEKIYYRFYLNCPKLVELLQDNAKKTKSSLDEIIPKVAYKLSKKKCDDIIKNNDKFFYIQINNNDKVEIYKYDNIWTEFYKQGSSQLFFEYNTCKIKLTFNETSNKNRKNAFFKGDVFYYHLMDERKDYYIFAIENPKNKEIYQIKFYKN